MYLEMAAKFMRNASRFVVGIRHKSRRLAWCKNSVCKQCEEVDLIEDFQCVKNKILYKYY